MGQAMRIAGLVLLGWFHTAGAQVLNQPTPLNAEPVSAVMTVPGKGSSKERVRSQFGQPGKVMDPVGNPPIERWVYDGFTVYFEDKFVLHSVKHNRQH